MNLILSTERYTAIQYASSVLTKNSIVVILSDGTNEQTFFNRLCPEALAVQYKFEVEKAYKMFEVRKVYYEAPRMDKLLVLLQLLVTINGVKNLYYPCFLDEDIKKLCRSLKGDFKLIRYGDATGCEKQLSALLFDLKIRATQRFVTVQVPCIETEYFITEER